MAFFVAVVILCWGFITASLAHSISPGIHLPLFRRGGRFSRHEPANLTHLAEILASVEAKYARSYRAVEGNRLVRRWRESLEKDENNPEVIDVVGRHGQW